jgi:hypothetical protein
MKKHLVAAVALLSALISPLFSQTSDAPPEQFATFSVWSQRMDMSPYKGKKYRLSVAIRADAATAESYAVAFIRNEPPEGGLRSWTYVDNMSDRPVRDSRHPAHGPALRPRAGCSRRGGPQSGCRLF